MSIRSLPAATWPALALAASALIFWAALVLLVKPAPPREAESNLSPSTSDRPSGDFRQELAEEHRALQADQMAASSAEHLESLYVSCALHTSVHRMDVDEAVFCQAVADVLTDRVFGGRLEALYAWRHDHRAGLAVLGGTTD